MINDNHIIPLEYACHVLAVLVLPTTMDVRLVLLTTLRTDDSSDALPIAHEHGPSSIQDTASSIVTVVQRPSENIAPPVVFNQAGSMKRTLLNRIRDLANKFVDVSTAANMNIRIFGQTLNTSMSKLDDSEASDAMRLCEHVVEIIETHNVSCADRLQQLLFLCDSALADSSPMRDEPVSPERTHSYACHVLIACKANMAKRECHITKDNQIADLKQQLKEKDESISRLQAQLEAKSK
ncbi:uncharacterized protein N7473_008258 [Penicillium subrubescens]|uniref:Uncharacterized protein n=1 Tax=Penicillium subrubescens TaxID=1316194 RepID=A0A1Q5TKH0_9EURO|nr:uncharacterized protein N7473_008258 [Penicillium subrubescens]KAJ5892030.1 hypothetical protein N7473_008258 [Penicillium subrubescens]OKP00728.1 hypothetical protein PENSUB_7659 [Penicillium subrubescens]